MDMRAGFVMRPHRDRPGSMRPGFPPIRGRGVVGMDRVRLCPPRPPIMKGAHPAFIGRPMIPQGRLRVPVLLGRLPMPPPGALGPLGPRGLMHPPRPMLPQRTLMPEGSNPNDLYVNPSLAVNIPLKGSNQYRENKEVNTTDKASHSTSNQMTGPQNNINCTNNSNLSANSVTNSSNNNNNSTGSDASNANINSSRDNRNNRVGRVNQEAVTYSQMNQKKNRKDNKIRSVIPHSHQQMQIPAQPMIQISHQPPIQNTHPSAVPHPQQSLSAAPISQQGISRMNPPAVQNHIRHSHTSHSHGQMPSVGEGSVINSGNTALVSHSSQMAIQQQPPVCSIRDGLNHSNRGNVHVGNRLNMMMNGPNVSVPLSPRGSLRISGPPPPSTQYSNAAVPTYHIPPPNIQPAQIPIKRGAPPPVVAPPTGIPPPPKRLRYDTSSVTANGYATSVYQQPPPQQQTTYPTSYEMPPPPDLYSSALAPPTSVSTVCSMPQSYNADYANYQVAAPQTNHSYSSLGMSSQQPQQHIPQQMQIQSQQPSVMQQPQYSSSSYNNVQSQSYTAYTSTSASGYDSNVDYSAMAAQPVSTADPYSGYSKPVSSVDSYGYSNSTYVPAQTGYEDYSSTYVDNSCYSQPPVDQSYNQPVGMYSNYSY